MARHFRTPHLVSLRYSFKSYLMSTLRIDLSARRNQTEFNLRRWEELLADTTLGRELARIEGRIEADRHGHIIMSPPPGLPHSRYQSAIAHRLRILLPGGEVLIECPISTADGVRSVDVIWISSERLRASVDKSVKPQRALPLSAKAPVKF